MSSTILEGRDGTLYDIPDEVLARFAVPGAKVRELRQRMAESAGTAGTAGMTGGGGESRPPASESASGDHPKLGELAADHPGYGQQQAIQAAVEMARAESGGAGVTVNLFVNGGAQPAVSMGVSGQSIDLHAAAEDSGVEGYHMSFDDNGIPVNHTDMLWGDYIDKQGSPAVGFHSHDPVHGNAQ